MNSTTITEKQALLCSAVLNGPIFYPPRASYCDVAGYATDMNILIFSIRELLDERLGQISETIDSSPFKDARASLCDALDDYREEITALLEALSDRMAESPAT